MADAARRAALVALAQGGQAGLDQYNAEQKALQDTSSQGTMGAIDTLLGNAANRNADPTLMSGLAGDVQSTIDSGATAMGDVSGAYANSIAELQGAGSDTGLAGQLAAIHSAAASQSSGGGGGSSSGGSAYPGGFATDTQYNNAVQGLAMILKEQGLEAYQQAAEAQFGTATEGGMTDLQTLANQGGVSQKQSDKYANILGGGGYVETSDPEYKGSGPDVYTMQEAVMGVPPPGYSPPSLTLPGGARVGTPSSLAIPGLGVSMSTSPDVIPNQLTPEQLDGLLASLTNQVGGAQSLGHDIRGNIGDMTNPANQYEWERMAAINNFQANPLESFGRFAPPDPNELLDLAMQQQEWDYYNQTGYPSPQAAAGTLGAENALDDYANSGTYDPNYLKAVAGRADIPLDLVQAAVNDVDWTTAVQTAEGALALIQQNGPESALDYLGTAVDQMLAEGLSPSVAAVLLSMYEPQFTALLDE